MSLGKAVGADEQQRFTDMIGALAQMSIKIHSGRNHSSLFSPEGESALTKEFNVAMSDLRFVMVGVDMPVQDCHIKPMQCIEYDEESEYIKRNPNAKPKDNWWSYLSFSYAFQGQTVSSHTLAVFGCYLDMHERTKGKLKDSYARNVVNIYIPTETYSEIYKRMVRASEFDAFAQGNEIIDHAQGLTSFLCQKGTKDSDLQIIMYRATYDNEEDPDEVTGYDRVKFPMPTLYESARGKPDHRIVGGVAFLKFGLGLGVEPGSYDSKSTLGPSTLPDVKIKLMGFHGLGFQGNNVKQISYYKDTTVEY
jgi:hypothetical protein